MEKRLPHTFSQGFTLIELLVVIAIVGLLTAAVLYAINPFHQIQKGRDTTRKANLESIRSALELYRSDVGQYPSTLYPAGTNSCNAPLAYNGVTYMNRVPCDPQGAVYVYSSNNTIYTIITCLENANDPSKDATTFSGCPTASYTLRNP